MLNKLNKAVTTLPSSGIRAFTNLAKSTPGCVLLTIGEPDFDTPAEICLAAKQDLDAGLTHYPPNQGEAFLRQAIADFERAQNGYDYSADEVIVTTGATGAIYSALTAILERGDQVIVPTPAFGLYQTITQLCGGEFVPLPIEDSGFQIRKEALCGKITAKTKAIILNSPNNPSGCILDEESLETVYQAAREHELFVLCDDVYQQLSYTSFPRFASYGDLKDRIVLIQSFSKPYAMTGWRVGYLCADAPIAAQMVKVHQNTVVSVPAFVQRACVKALESNVSGMRDTYQRRRDYVYERICQMGLTAEKPQGAFYIFPSIKQSGLSSEEFCTRMIKEAGLAAVPGSIFGTEGYIRLSYCYSDETLKTGLDRLKSFISNL